MPTPSNPSGIPSLPVAGLLAVILFLGLALAPRAFEFRAWPEPTRHAAIEEVVDRPVAPVTEVQVAGVTAESSRREPGATERVERKRRPERRSARVSKVVPTPPQAREGSSGYHSRPAPAAPAKPEIVVETPAPPKDVEEQPPAQPAQLAERPPVDQVLRPEPEPEAFVPEVTSVNDFDLRAAGGDKGKRRDRGQGRSRGHGKRPSRLPRGN
jgi:hypothetical protein